MFAQKISIQYAAFLVYQYLYSWESNCWARYGKNLLSIGKKSFFLASSLVCSRLRHQKSIECRVVINKRRDEILSGGVSATAALPNDKCCVLNPCLALSLLSLSANNVIGQKMSAAASLLHGLNVALRSSEFHKEKCIPFRICIFLSRILVWLENMR